MIHVRREDNATTELVKLLIVVWISLNKTHDLNKTFPMPFQACEHIRYRPQCLVMARLKFKTH